MATIRRLIRWFQGSFPGKLLERFLELNPFERGLALGSKLFTSVVPLSIIVAGLFGGHDVLATRLVLGFGLTGEGAAAVNELFSVPSAWVWTLAGLVGLGMLLYSLFSFAQALQRAYEAAWHLPPLRSRGMLWGGVWIVAFAAYFGLSSPLARLLYEHGFRVGGTVVSLIGGSLLWLITPFVLLGRRVPLRVLVPGGVASALLLTGFNLYSNVYLPGSMTSDVRRYGLIGVTLVLLSWLFAFSLVLVGAAACGAVLGERRHDWTDPRARTPLHAGPPHPEASPATPADA